MARSPLRTGFLVACCAIATVLPLGVVAQEPPEPSRSLSYDEVVLQAQGQRFLERVTTALCDEEDAASRWYERATLQAQGQSLEGVAAAACDVTIA